MKIQSMEGGVCAARGFKAARCAAGIKYQGRDDMAMIFSEAPCGATGTFTSNRVKAAPVLWDQEIVRAGHPVQAVVVNAGIANAATGAQGLALCSATAAAAGQVLSIPKTSVLLGSTGVIGPQLPVEKIVFGIAAMSLSLSETPEAATAASRAIMTTDTVNKETAVAFELPAAEGEAPVTVHLGGMSKGSGMIHPNMCTMLAYLTSDCAIDPALMQKALSEVVQDTFNMISVDGDTSTNDTLLLLCNGLAGNAPIREEGEAYNLFREALFTVCRNLAVRMAADGEGATHLVEMRVTGADTKENARILARSVVSSSLVKAMVYGRDANCGRILCALGYAGPAFDPDRVDLFLEGPEDRLCFCRDGQVLSFDEEKALALMSADEVRFTCDLKMGEAEATAWGCDLTLDYVRINGDYRS